MAVADDEQSIIGKLAEKPHYNVIEGRVEQAFSAYYWGEEVVSTILYLKNNPQKYILSGQSVRVNADERVRMYTTSELQCEYAYASAAEIMKGHKVAFTYVDRSQDVDEFIQSRKEREKSIQNSL